MKDIMGDELGAPKIVDRSAFQAGAGRTAVLVQPEMER
jgi:hypothetical protein